jgi:undecaprenyl-phosphate 4-deoxy-4-formamido-L-arabinose transferase
VLIRWALFGSVAGFTFLASAIAIFAGIQLFALGLIGEYIARIHVRSMGRPSYVEDTDTDIIP